MKESKVSYYEVSYDPNVDFGGHHGKNVIGKFVKSSDAYKFAEGKGAWGADADVNYVTNKIQIWESYEEAIQSSDDALKKQILDKLSKKEKELLGLA